MPAMRKSRFCARACSTRPFSVESLNTVHPCGVGGRLADYAGVGVSTQAGATGAGGWA